jgi:small subunit ribosomal protein S7
MPRRSQVFRKKINTDPKYKNALVERLIVHIMQRGKKTVATKIVYGAFDVIAEKTKKDPLAIFDRAIKNVSPSLEVKSRRIGGANYQIPFEVRGERRVALALRWILEATAAKKGKPTAQKLAQELIDASQGQGSAIKKKGDTHRMAFANKAFAHYA